MHLFYQYLIVFCFNLLFALPASSIKLSVCNSTKVLLSFSKKVVQACYHNLDKCTDKKQFWNVDFYFIQKKCLSA